MPYLMGDYLTSVAFHIEIHIHFHYLPPTHASSSILLRQIQRVSNQSVKIRHFNMIKHPQIHFPSNHNFTVPHFLVSPLMVVIRSHLRAEVSKERFPGLVLVLSLVHELL